MTDEQITSIEERITALVEAKVEERNGGKAMRVIQFLTSILLGCVTAVIIPFGVWTVQQIHKLDLADREMQNRVSVQQAWMDQGPRFTSKDADNMKLQVMSDVSEKLSKELSRVSEKLDKMSDAANQNGLSLMQVRMEMGELKSMVSKRAP